MTAITWIAGLVRHRGARLVATGIGVAVGVALIASIGTFLSSANSQMTERAIARVSVDWQVQAQPGADRAKVLKQVASYPGVQAALPVNIAETPGLAAKTGGTSQRTGSGFVLGLPRGYAKQFPGEIRTLAGNTGGAVLAQQTAANLRARPGDVVQVQRPGLPPVKIPVAGVVELPAADSLFQRVGAPVGAQAQAPPDNVVLMPQAEFQKAIGPVSQASPTSVTYQVHVALNHNLPASPSAAFTQVSGQARNLEIDLAGQGRVGDNLGSALDQARGDALYAQILFLFLGAPGAIIAALLTASVASAGADRRRRDAALLRTRGASTGSLLRLALIETAIAGGVGIVAGLGAALLIGQAAFGSTSFGAGTFAAVAWAAGSALAGVLIAALALALPAYREARSLTVSGQRRQIGRVERSPWWARYGIDFVCLAIAAGVYWQASRNGYKLVLAPEGVPQVSVNWYALLAPVFGWIGGGLLAFRIADLFLARGARPLRLLLRPVAGGLSPTVASTMSRQRRVLARSVALLALTAAFAGSTAIFNSTYRQQAEVDARLSNGADVTVTESPGAQVGPAAGQGLTGVAGVQSVEPLQHRYAYVGADLQDLYGVDPATIGAAGQLQNAWFQGGTADQLMSTLAQKPDSVLVSAETVKDFQLHPGDLVRLRLQDGQTKKYMTVPFHYAGIANEFPTAPTDSFLVANASYVAQQTGSDAVGSFLIQTDGTSPATVAADVRSAVGSGAQVTDIVNQRKVVGSNLTAVELSGLTKVELGFALMLAVVASGLTLALSFRERRRSFAIASAIGARGKQLGGFVWGEAVFVTGLGLLLGTAIAAGLTLVLVKVLTGVFDPPPDVLSIPSGYLLALVGLVIAAVAAGGALTLRQLRRPAIEELRDI